MAQRFFNVSFQNDEPEVINGIEQVVRPHRWVYYTFKFNEEAMTKGKGYITITCDIDYGSVGIRTRRLHKKIEVEYVVDDQGFIRHSNATPREDHEIAI